MKQAASSSLLLPVSLFKFGHDNWSGNRHLESEPTSPSDTAGTVPKAQDTFRGPWKWVNFFQKQKKEKKKDNTAWLYSLYQCSHKIFIFDWGKSPLWQKCLNRSDNKASVQERPREWQTYQAWYHSAAESTPAASCLLLLCEASNASLLNFYKTGSLLLAAKFMPLRQPSCQVRPFVSSEDAECKEVRAVSWDSWHLG